MNMIIVQGPTTTEKNAATQASEKKKMHKVHFIFFLFSFLIFHFVYVMKIGLFIQLSLVKTFRYGSYVAGRE